MERGSDSFYTVLLASFCATFDRSVQKMTVRKAALRALRLKTHRQAKLQKLPRSLIVESCTTRTWSRVCTCAVRLRLVSCARSRPLHGESNSGAACESEPVPCLVSKVYLTHTNICFSHEC